MFPKVLLGVMVAGCALLAYLPEAMAADSDFAADEIRSSAANRATSIIAELPYTKVTTRPTLLVRGGTLGELLRATYTTTAAAGKVAKKTKTFTDKQLGVTLRYPSTIRYQIGRSTDKKLVEVGDYFQMYEFVHRDAGVTLGYSMVSTTMGPLFWSLINEVNKEEVAKFAAQGLAIKDKTLALRSGHTTTTYAGHVLRNDFVSYNGTVVMGAYSGSIKLPSGVFMGVAVFYSSIAAINKDEGVLSAQQAQEMIATLLTKSKFDTKKIQKHFLVE